MATLCSFHITINLEVLPNVFFLGSTSLFTIKYYYFPDINRKWPSCSCLFFKMTIIEMCVIKLYCTVVVLNSQLPQREGVVLHELEVVKLLTEQEWT